MPGISAKLGAGSHDDLIIPFINQPLWSRNVRVITDGEWTGGWGILWLLFRIYRWIIKGARFPRRQRLEQLYGPRLENYSVMVKS